MTLKLNVKMAASAPEWSVFSLFLAVQYMRVLLHKVTEDYSLYIRIKTIIGHKK